MRRPALILKEIQEVSTIAALTAVFEGIASMEIGKIRDVTLSSKEFFAVLWNIYIQLRVDKKQISQRQLEAQKNGRQLLVAFTSQGGLSGDIDGRVIDLLLKEYDPKIHDVIVCGERGGMLLAQRGVEAIAVYPMPETRQAFIANPLEPMVAQMHNYTRTFAYYQTYISLARQDVAKIEMLAAVKAMSEETHGPEEVISQRDYDFEPSLDDIVDYLESAMLSIVLSQVILESTLSQSASRFSAMAGAKKRAEEMYTDLRLQYNRARRAVNEERTREIISVLKKDDE